MTSTTAKIPTANKVLVIAAYPIPDVEALFETRGKRAAKWLTRAFRRLYADKRNGGWKLFGPGVVQGADGLMYGAIVRPKKEKDGPDDGGEDAAEPMLWKVNHRALYPAFAAKNSFPLFGLRTITDAQAILPYLATAWQNFLNGPAGETPRPAKNIKRVQAGYRRRCRNRRGKRIVKHVWKRASKRNVTNLPAFKPLVVFSNVTVRFRREEAAIVLSLPHPENGRERIEIPLAWSDDHRKNGRGYSTYFAELLRFVDDGSGRPTVEFHRKNGRWYAHIRVEVEVPKMAPRRATTVLGVHLGVKNVATTAIASVPEPLPATGNVVSSSVLRRKLEHIQRKIAVLRSKARHGSRSAARKLRRMKGRRQRLQDTFVKETMHHIANGAVKAGATAIVKENLKNLHPVEGTKPKRVNREISIWARGKAEDILGFKCVERGLRLKLVNPAGTSATCPNCGDASPENRDREASLYTCRACGYQQHDDIVGAINIARRGIAYYASPKWDEDSPSTPHAGGKGDDAAGAQVGADTAGPLAGPHATKGRGTAARKRAPAGKAKTNRTNGPDERPAQEPAVPSDTSPGSPGRDSGQSSAPVAEGRPETARVVDDEPPPTNGAASGSRPTDPSLAHGSGPPR